MKTVYNPVYDYELYVFKGDKHLIAVKFASKLLNYEYDPAAGTIEACVFRNVKYRTQVIWFRDKKPAQETIAHEAFHSTCGLFRYMDCMLNDNTEEVFARVLDWTVQNIK